jgi:hypothetical protein
MMKIGLPFTTTRLKGDGGTWTHDSLDLFFHMEAAN